MTTYVAESHGTLAAALCDNSSPCSVSTPMEFDDDGPRRTLRPVLEDGEAKLSIVGLSGLSDASHQRFAVRSCESDDLVTEFGALTQNSLHQHDLHVVALDPKGHSVVGHGFLLSVHDIVPELGLVVAEQMLSLKAAAAAVDREVIKLMTAETNGSRTNVCDTVGGCAMLDMSPTPSWCDGDATTAGAVVGAKILPGGALGSSARRRQRHLRRLASVSEIRSAMAVSLSDGEAPWTLSTPIRVDDERVCIFRPLCERDEAKLCRFAFSGLSEASRELFTSYHWASDGLVAEFGDSIRNSLNRRDLHLVAVDPDDGSIVAQGFLLSIQDPVPVLGLAVADDWQGCGLGTRMLLLLEAAAAASGRAAIELTTMQNNARAKRVCEKVGYELLGIIRSTSGCEATAAILDSATPTDFRDEFHMVRILDEAKQGATLEALRVARAGEHLSACGDEGA
mmetsp:Transcript_82382/g.266807  ORF Transcript_82382/g.266807 Transcript_82382/m.266807 type:complete len:452 (+) Transcript_82382:71-1426(+)